MRNESEDQPAVRRGRREQISQKCGLQIRQEVAILLKHAKLTPGQRRMRRGRNRRDGVKDGKKAEAKTNKTEQKPKTFERRKPAWRVFMVDSVRTAIRM